MARVIVFSIAALFCQVQSQICVNPGPTSVISAPQIIPTTQIVSPQVLTPVVTSPIIATTVVDNSVSNGLANALQLLIVSDLIESRLGASLLSRNLIDGIRPIVETIGPQVVDVVAPCASAVDIISPCAPVIDTITPNYYGRITETITPNIFGGYSDTICSNPFGVTETITPNYYGGWTETITPNLCGATEIISPNLGFENIATVTPNIYGGVTEVISNSPCAPQLPLFGGVNEIITSSCGPNYYNGEVDIVPTCGPNYYGNINEIIPNSFYGGIPEVISSYNPGCLGGVTEVISGNPYAPNIYGNLEVISTSSPYNSILRNLPEVITPSFGPYFTGIADFSPYSSNCFGAPEIIANPYIPNNYGGFKEVITPTGPFAPVAAEVLLPSAVPTQLTCNLGYMQSPCAPQLPLFGGVNEIITSTCGPNYYNGEADIVPTCGSNYYGNINGLIPNSFYGGIPEVISSYNPGCLGGVTEVISGNPYAPNMYGNLEVISRSSPCNSILRNLPEVITPSYGPYYTGIADFSPYSSNCLEVPEIISNPYIPNSYGGFKEIITPTGPFAPVAAEVLLPSTIPAQLTCNFGYMPTTVPCVSVNVEALPFDACGCGCNGYPKGFFY